MTNTASGGGRILGTLRAEDGKGAVRMEDRFDTDIDDLWSALTEPPRLARWIGNVEGDLRLGGEIHAVFFRSGSDWVGRIAECEPPRHFLVETNDADEEDLHTIEATLASEGDQTLLVVEERGMPLDKLAAYGAGIQLHVEDLGAHIAGRELGDDSRWEELEPVYDEIAAKIA